MDLQSNFEFQNQQENSTTNKIDLSKIFASVKALLTAKATEQRRRNELDDFELLHRGIRED